MEMLCVYFLLLSFYIFIADLVPTPTSSVITTTDQEDEILGDTRRIIYGQKVFDNKPYMVYLRPTRTLNNQDDLNWLCGGVIIHERYILTSAACIEDVKYFYVVSGTNRWVPWSETSECIENGAMRAIWKCVQRTYRFDGRTFNNIHWMVNDIAVVMLEGAISFKRLVKGCDFIPQKIRYNNISAEYEKPGTEGFLAGWGSQDEYTDAADIIARTSVNSPQLLEAHTTIISKKACISYWLDRYHDIIEKYMICGTMTRPEDMTSDCKNQHTECRKLVLSEEHGPRNRRFESNPDKLLLDSDAQVRRRRKKPNTRRMFSQWGGFCENDHGGPFLVGRGATAIVVGIMSAYRVENNSKRCHGPYLYSSVYKNRQLIHCAIYKEEGFDCPILLRDNASVLEEQTYDWGNMTVRPRAVYEDEDESPMLRSTNDTNK